MCGVVNRMSEILSCFGVIRGSLVFVFREKIGSWVADTRNEVHSKEGYEENADDFFELFGRVRHWVLGGRGDGVRGWRG